MSIHTFSREEIEALMKHPCILKVSERSIAFTFDFKKHALELYEQGVSSREIWRQSGLNFRRSDYPRECMKRWRGIVKKKGLRGLNEESRGIRATGRPKTKGLTDVDRIKRLELEVAYLKAENAFLTQLRAKRAESNSGRTRNMKS